MSANAVPPNNSSSQTLVLRNTLVLVIAQAATIPLSVIVNALIARRLGPGEFGSLYLAAMFTASGFLVVEWGQASVLPAAIAKERNRAAELLGSALLWRFAFVFVVYAALALGCAALGYSHEFQILIALQCFGSAIGSMTIACQDTVRGFERTDVAAYAQVGTQVLSAVFVAVALFFGGRLPGVLLAFAAANSAVLIFVWRGLRSTGVRKLTFRKQTLKRLAIEGTPFFFFGLTMTLQPNLDALFMSKLASAEVIGWHAAARKLVGVLTYPAGALIAALYPTLCRLYVEDIDAYRRTARSAIETAAVVVAPLAIGCCLYADLGILIFSKQSFGAAANNLRVLAVFIFLVYFSMPLGSCLLAAGRQRTWTLVQSLCIVVSLVFDPILIPWFQAHTGNGGLGVCSATVASELLMLAAAVWLVPSGIFDRGLRRQLLRVAVSGCAMIGVGWALRFISAFLAAPIAVVAYLACLRAVGGLTNEQLQSLKAMVRRKSRQPPVISPDTPQP